MGKVLLQGLECYKDTEMKVYNMVNKDEYIAKLAAELKSDNVRYRIKMYFFTMKCFLHWTADQVVLFMSIVPHLDLLGAGKQRLLMN